MVDARQDGSDSQRGGRHFDELDRAGREDGHDLADLAAEIVHQVARQPLDVIDKLGVVHRSRRRGIRLRGEQNAPTTSRR